MQIFPYLAVMQGLTHVVAYIWSCQEILVGFYNSLLFIFDFIGDMCSYSHIYVTFSVTKNEYPYLQDFFPIWKYILCVLRVKKIMHVLGVWILNLWKQCLKVPKIGPRRIVVLLFFNIPCFLDQSNAFFFATIA